MMQKIYNFIREKKEQGQSIIEYGILITVIIASIVSVKNSLNVQEQLTAIGSKVNYQFTQANEATTGQPST